MKKTVFTASLAALALSTGACVTMESTTTSKSEDSDLQEISGVVDGEWRITQFNNDVAPASTAPTIVFGEDGRVYGSTGCNNFNANYTLGSDAITLSPMAVTRRACDPGLMEQERRFLEVMTELNSASLDPDGRLVLEGPENLRLVAERNK